jgi:hypothetical protein
LIAPQRTLLDRLLAAYPLVVAYLVLLILYAWQTTRIPSPWIFTDELQWSLLSRGVAHTGHPQLRAHAAGSPSIYSYFLAPAWWLGATAPGYAAAKYLNAIAMTASIFPAYGFARLFLRRLPSYGAAIASAAIPSLALTGVLMPESPAYFWSTLVLFLLALALLRPSRWTVGAAVAALAVAPLIRDQLKVLAAGAVIAVVIMTVTGSKGRATIARWSLGDRVGVLTLALGALIAADVFLAHHSYEWLIGTHFWHRAFTYGLWALGALTIGVGVLPVFLALAWALGGPSETREDRALLALLAGSAAGFGLYTAVKASYLSAIFAIRVEERNLIYLSPVAFVAAGRWLSAGRPKLLPVLLSGAAVGWLLWATPYHAYEHLYSDAFGLSILQWLNQTWHWTISDLRWLLFGILAGGMIFAVAVRAAPQGKTALGVAAAVLGAATIGWNLTGEISAANQAVAPGAFQRSLLPTPADWIDRETGRARTLFIGKSLSNSVAFWTLEFWNQSIQDVWSVDASAPPPGPSTTPDFGGTDGRLSPQLPDAWAVTQPELVMRGSVAEKAGGLTLYRVPHPIRMIAYVSGISSDGWMEKGIPARYVRFAARPVRGTLTISLSRAAACGDLALSRFSFRVSRLRIDEHRQPVAGKTETTLRSSVTSTPCEQKTVRAVVTAPFRVDGVSRGAFRSGDGRDLAAQVGFAFVPDRS